MMDLHTRCVDLFRGVQEAICTTLTSLDGKPFQEDLWDHANGGGGGRSRVLTEGNVFEKAGVNFSAVNGRFSEEMAKSMPGDGNEFQATGVSLVLHPWNPKAPTVHANFRHLTRGAGGWFGGGADLTPCYPYRKDCVHFHRVWQAACDRRPAVADHPRFKKWCDEYFYLPHRQETRGVGGIFFDYLDQEPEETFAFVKDCAERFLDAYLPIVQRRIGESYTAAERDFQLYRRGRYVEFNLLYDRGTVFGLKTGGRVESILMSLPLNAKWLYNWTPVEGTWEAELYRCLTPQDWVNDPPFGR